MMVDDDTIVSEIVQTYLEDAGYNNLVAINDPRDALESVRHENPDLLLLDLRMPGVSGFDILEAIRADEELKYLPVIVLTAATDPASKLKALELGASEFLAKPVDQSELILRVRNSLAFKVYQDHLAYSDAVTGLPNRRIFLRRLMKIVTRAAMQGGMFALLHIDLDRFKQINDSLGHHVGDQMLKATADRLNQCLRGTDVVAFPGQSGAGPRAHRRRRVRDPASRIGHQPECSPGHAAPAPCDRSTFPERRQGAVPHGERRHCGMSRRRRGFGDAAQERGIRDVPGKTEWPQSARVLLERPQ